MTREAAIARKKHIEKPKIDVDVSALCRFLILRSKEKSFFCDVDLRFLVC